MKCAQTGRRIKDQVGELAREDQQPLREKDPAKGSNLVVSINGTDYPLWILLVCLLVKAKSSRAYVIYLW